MDFIMFIIAVLSKAVAPVIQGAMQPNRAVQNAGLKKSILTSDLIFYAIEILFTASYMA